MKKSIKSLMAITLVASTLVGCGMANDNNQAGTRNYNQAGTRSLDQTGYNQRGLDNSVGIRNTADATPAADKGYFTDVPSTRWSSESIEWAREQGIMQGTGQGFFNPNQPLTREQMAAVIKNLADKGYITIPTRDTDETPGTDETPEMDQTPATPGAGDTTPTPTAPGAGDTTPTPATSNK